MQLLTGSCREAPPARLARWQQKVVKAAIRLQLPKKWVELALLVECNKQCIWRGPGGQSAFGSAGGTDDALVSVNRCSADCRGDSVLTRRLQRSDSVLTRRLHADLRVEPLS